MLLPLFKQVRINSQLRPSSLTNVELAWYCTVDSLVTTVIVIVINESLDSKEQVRAVFLQLDVNVLVFYRFPKSFNPNVVFGAASASASSQSAPCSPSLSSSAICVMTRPLTVFRVMSRPGPGICGVNGSVRAIFRHFFAFGVSGKAWVKFQGDFLLLDRIFCFKSNFSAFFCSRTRSYQVGGLQLTTKLCITAVFCQFRKHEFQNHIAIL